MPQDKQCCENGNFGDGHICLKQSHTPTSPKTATEEEILESFNKEKRNFEVYGPLGMGIDYMKLKSFISQAFKAGEALGQQNGMRMVYDEIPETELTQTYIDKFLHLKQQLKYKYNL